MAGLLGHISRDEMYLCPECNNYGFPSTYTLIKVDHKTGLCTTCANTFRAGGRHDVNIKTMEIKRKS